MFFSYLTIEYLLSTSDIVLKFLYVITFNFENNSIILILQIRKLKLKEK